MLHKNPNKSPTLELDAFLDLISEFEQQDCVEFITELFEQNPELMESEVVARQFHTQ
jgi:hypothetical protein